MIPHNQSRPPLRSVPVGNGRSPFTRTSDLLPITAHLSFLLPKPDDEMLMSEALAFADDEARKWAAQRGTQVIGRTTWYVGDIEVDGRVTLIRPPGPVRRIRGGIPHPDDCAKCAAVAKYPDEWSATQIAAALGWAKSTVYRHRDPLIKTGKRA